MIWRIKTYKSPSPAFIYSLETEKGVNMPDIRIGVDISSATSVEDALQRAGLGWKVDKLETYFAHDEEQRFNLTKSGKYVAIVRRDTGEEFAHPTKRYEVAQNITSFKWVETLVSEGATFWRAGSFRGGRKVFMLVTLPIPLTLADGDTIARAMIISTSHDTSQGIRASWLPFRFACANIIAASLAQAPMVFRHTASIRDGISSERAREIFYNAELFYDQYYKRANALASAPFSDHEMELLIETLFSAPRRTESRRRRSNDYLYERVLQNFRNGRETYGSSRWDAYNAVCEYLDYQRPIGNSLDTAESTVAAVENERQYNSILSTNRFGGNKIRTEALTILTEDADTGYLPVRG